MLENWRKYISEIEKRASLGDSRVDVDWAADKANEINSDKFDYQGIQLQLAKSEGQTKLIAYLENQPVGYMGLDDFKNGVKVGTLSVKLEFEGKGIASRMYDYIIQNYNLYSGDSQTPKAQKIWNKLRKKYPATKTVNVETGEEVTDPNTIYTKEGDPPNNIYLFIPRGG